MVAIPNIVRRDYRFSPQSNWRLFDNCNRTGWRGVLPVLAVSPDPVEDVGVGLDVFSIRIGLWQIPGGLEGGNSSRLEVSGMISCSCSEASRAISKSCRAFAILIVLQEFSEVLEWPLASSGIPAIITSWEGSDMLVSLGVFGEAFWFCSFLAK
jgi:hypothetical protein